MAFLGSMPPVGPIAVMLLERGVSGRYREGRGIALGATIAETLYCALAMAGISELMSRYAIVETIARALGVVILFALGIHFARLTIAPREEATDSTNKRASFGAAFGLGFGVSAANPVLIITWSGSIATLLSFAHLRFTAAERAAFVAGVFAGMFAWFHLFLWLLQRYRSKITLHAAQWSVRVAGAAMIALALWGARLVLIPLHH